MKAIVLAAVLMFAAPAHARGVEQWQPLIAEASVRFGVPTRWIERVMRAESAGMRDGRPIRSRAGAMGLMQLMPGTWADMRARLGLGEDPDDPRDNILAGTLYLRLMYDRFGYPGLFGAYNAGPVRYAAYLANRQPLPGETIDYLEKVAGALPRSIRVPLPGLFAVRRDQRGAITASELAGPTKPDVPGLFAIRSVER